MPRRWSPAVMRGRSRTLEACALMTAGGLLQRWVPMRWWSGLLGQPGELPVGWTGVPTRDSRIEATGRVERAVAQAIRNASGRLPWEPTCLAQAIAAQVMLRRRDCGGVVVIGLRRAADGPAWEAHAWLIGAAVTVTGAPAGRAFTPATVFSVRGGLQPADLAEAQTA